MEELLIKIADNMTNEKAFYIELLELSQAKTAIVTEKRIKDLEKIVEMEQDLIVRIGNIDGDRQDLLEELASFQGVPGESITLTHLIQWSNGDIKARFQSLQDDFQDIVNRQQHLNEVNSKLIETNLEYVDFALHLMAGQGESGKVYEKKGQVSQGNQNRNLFDTQA